MVWYGMVPYQQVVPGGIMVPVPPYTLDRPAGTAGGTTMNKD